MRLIALFLMLSVFWGSCGAAAAQDTSGTAGEASAASSSDWLGVGPIYSLGSLFWPGYPYYAYYNPSYLHPWPYVQPFYYYPPSYIGVYPEYPWWVGGHKDLDRTLAIARTGSSMKVYANGIWQTP